MGQGGWVAGAARHGCARRRLGLALLASSSALAILAAAPVAQAQAITVPPNVQNITIAPGSTTTSISIANNGTVGTPATKTAILLQGGATLPGGITNGGLITATAVISGAAISVQGMLAGGITNRGLIAATAFENAAAISVQGMLAGGLTNTGTIAATSNYHGHDVLIGGTLSGGITNLSLITTTGKSAAGIYLTNAAVGTGSLVSAFGEAGYGIAVGEGAWLTPYVNLDYIHQHVDAFSEAGSFGAFAVAPANGSSLTTTLGLRASTSIDLGSHGTLVPEVRAGWQHEFLDASQTLTAQLVGTAASPFAVVGTSFGRDSAVVGVGVSHEFAPGASFFMDYDDQFTGGFNQNSGSVGIRVKF
jgi:hypothetical protein